MAESHITTATGSEASPNGARKKQILLNAFDMSTVGHLSPGQWKVSSKMEMPFPSEPCLTLLLLRAASKYLQFAEP